MSAQLLHIGGTARGHLPAIVDPVDGVTALAADSITYVVRRNGVDTADTITIGSMATGLNEWSYNPAGESEGEQISIRFTIILTDSGSTIRTVFYAVDLVVVAVERGTDLANTTTPLDAAGIRSAVGLASANLDTQIATLSTYDGSDTAGVTALLNRLSAARAGYLDNLIKLDATISGIADSFLAHVIAKGNPGTVERAFWQVSKAQVSIDGVVVEDVANTATLFQTDLTVDDYKGQTIVFVSGTLTGQARTIVSTVSGVITVERAFTDAPADADEFLITASSSPLIADIAGSGAYTITVTVTDGTNPIQSASVRLTKSGQTALATTNASGVAVVNVDAGTFVVAITHAVHTFGGASLVVEGHASVTYAMTAVTTTPPTNPSLSAIEVLCLDQTGAVQSGVAIDFRLVSVPSGDQNKAYSGAKLTATSNNSGIARVEAIQGARYEYKRGTANVWQTVTVDNDGATNVVSVIGTP